LKGERVSKDGVFVAGDACLIEGNLAIFSGDALIPTST